MLINPAPKNFIEYLIFSDESTQNCGRFHAISTITIPKEKAKSLHNELKLILEKYSITEFKWNKFNGDSKYTKCANEFLKFINENSQYININTIIWDTEDSRHCIKNRDDNKNFEIMYYRVLNHQINKLNSNITYSLFPDEKYGMNWDKLENFLSSKNDIFFDGAITKTKSGIRIDGSKIRNAIKNIKPTESEKCIFIQIADLIAGLSVFSYIKYNEFKSWKNFNNNQLSFFQKQAIKVSKSSKVRFEFLSEVIASQKINIDRKKGLNTENPKSYINFWFYSPQKDYDKAPIK